MDSNDYEEKLREIRAALNRIPKYMENPEFKKALKQSSVVISVGGHHFTTMLSRDLVSSINFDAMVASSYRRIICFSQSFGPFDFHNPKNRLLTQRLLSNSILMPREEKSVKEIHTFLGKEEAEVIPTYESVLTLANHIQYLPIEQRDNAVGIAIYCTQSRTVEERKHYQQTIADFCNYVIDKGYSIRFFPMEIKGSAPDDRGFIAEIIAKVLRADKCFIYEDDMETLEHLEEVSKCGYRLESYRKMDLENEQSFDSLFFMEEKITSEALERAVPRLFVEKSCGEVFRIKGFVKNGAGQWMELNATQDSHTMQSVAVGQEGLIVIGEYLQEDKIREILKEEETCQS